MKFKLQVEFRNHFISYMLIYFLCLQTYFTNALPFVNGYIAKLGYKECEKLPRLSHQIYVASSEGGWAFSPWPFGKEEVRFWRRGGGDPPSFSYFQTEKYLESKHAIRCFEKYPGTDKSPVGQPSRFISTLGKRIPPGSKPREATSGETRLS